MPPKIVSICGNIGCGKTTLLNLLDSKYNKKCMLEGIKNWGDILELSYAQPEKYSLAFQLRIVSEQTLQKEAILNLDCDYVFTERSSDDGRHVFVNAKKMDNHLDDVMIHEFDRWIDIHKMGIKPDLIVYLRADPEIAFSRIKQRQQAGDKFIEMKYLEMLHNFYEKRYCPERLGHDLYPEIKIPKCENEKILVLEDFSPEETAQNVLKWLNIS